MTSAPDPSPPRPPVADADTPSLDTPSFDARARDAHARALDRVSARTQAQLAQRRNAALRGTSPRPASALWPVLATGSAVAIAVVLGVRMMPGGSDTTVALAPSLGAPSQSSPSRSAPPHHASTTTPAATPRIDVADDTGTVAVNDARPSVHVADNDTDATLDTLIDEAFGAGHRVADDDTLSFAVAALDPESSAGALPAGFETFEETPDLYLWLADDTTSGGDMESL